MTDSVFMKILNTRYYLLRESTCFIIFKSSIFSNIIKEFSSWCIFHNKKKLLWCFNHLKTKVIITLTKNKWLTSYSWITFGCLTIFNILISRFTLSISFWSFNWIFSMILIATFCYVIKCVPNLILPNIPYPSTFFSALII